MMDNPTIQRIRKVRHQISASFGHDPYRLVDYYIKQQEQYSLEARQRKTTHGKIKTVDEVARMLYRKGRKPVSVEDMDAAVARAFKEGKLG